MALPTPRALLTTLLSALNSHDNRTNALDANRRPHLLTLHVLYPNELLPALDLLDRGLVYRLGASETEDNNEDETQIHPKGQQAVYYVRSSRPAPGGRDDRPSTSSYHHHHHHHRAPEDAPSSSATYHEVRPTAWSCSCAAFVFAAFPAVDHPDDDDDDDDDDGEDEDGASPAAHVARDAFCRAAGGLSRGSASRRRVPMCKHLLACALVQSGGFGGAAREMVEEGVGMEAVAGWAAGWGD